MSGTVIAIGEIREGKSMLTSLVRHLVQQLAECNEDATSEMKEKIEGHIPQYRSSFALDVMRSDRCVILSNLNIRDMAVFSGSEGLSRIFTQDGMRKDMTVSPYLPASICIYGRIEKQIVSSENCSLIEDDYSSGEDATERQSDELPVLSVPRAHLWSDRRRLRKRACNFLSVPWKLNNDWNCNNAGVRSTSICA